ncbi:hypothetical protein JKP88DRAFT_228902 [Tribonema minus]|uniref:Uncharacterized protein n=1 Tax=Tribonema minus TaxID=303371 RepID=A0A835YHR7_9STRA|nr:hypothetical protein JKP88DRAFT_228902 [Tribonema minus]
MRAVRCAGAALALACYSESVCNAFLQQPVQWHRQHQLATTLHCAQPGERQAPAVDLSHGLSEATIEELWRKPKKELLKIGQGGVTASHVRSLTDLVQHHTIVRVKVNTKGASYEDCLALGQALVSGEGEERGLRLVGVRPSTRLLLVGEAAFIDRLPKE